MTLLREVMEQPLDPGYAAAARARAERAAAGDPSPSRARRVVRSGAVAVVAALAGFAVAAGVQQLRLPPPPGTSEALAREVEQRAAAASRAAEDTTRLRAEVAAIQERELGGEQEALLETARDLSLAAGTAEVTGPGIVVTLDDVPGPGGPDPLDGDAALPGADGQDLGRVLHRDVFVVANGLWAAGAEAVAVNGQRLSSLSAISTAGDAVLVDFRPLSPPYRIAAVGDPGDLEAGFAASRGGAYAAALESDFGLVVDITRDAELRLPADDSEDLRFAEPVPPATAAARALAGSAGTDPFPGAAP